MNMHRKCVNLLNDESCVKRKCLFGFVNRRCVLAGPGVLPGTTCRDFKQAVSGVRIPAAAELQQLPMLDDVRANLANALIARRGESPMVIDVDRLPSDDVDELKTELTNLGYVVNVNTTRMMIAWA